MVQGLFGPGGHLAMAVGLVRPGGGNFDAEDRQPPESPADQVTGIEDKQPDIGRGQRITGHRWKRSKGPSSLKTPHLVQGVEPSALSVSCKALAHSTVCGAGGVKAVGQVICLVRAEQRASVATVKVGIGRLSCRSDPGRLGTDHRR